MWSCELSVIFSFADIRRPGCEAHTSKNSAECKVVQRSCSFHLLFEVQILNCIQRGSAEDALGWRAQACNNWPAEALLWRGLLSFICAVNNLWRVNWILDNALNLYIQFAKFFFVAHARPLGEPEIWREENLQRRLLQVFDLNFLVGGGSLGVNLWSRTEGVSHGRFLEES